MRNTSITCFTSSINLKSTRSERLSLALIFYTSLFFSTTILAAPPPPPVTGNSSVELTVRLNSNSKTMEVINQRILDFPPPKNRGGTSEGKQLVFQLEDSLGGTIGSVPVNDPTELRSEWVDEESQEKGLLTGSSQTVSETVFTVIVPLDEKLDRVKLLKPQPSKKARKSIKGQIGTLQATATESDEILGSSNVDNVAIKAFLQRKKQQ